MEQIRLPTRHEPTLRTAAPVRAAQVHVVDDDAGVRAALARLLRSRDYEVIVHENAEAFLASHDHDTAGCILLDVSMPGLDGPGLQD